MGAHGTITDQKKQEIKTLLTMYGIRESARKARVSFYTAWCVANGKYDQPHLQMGRLEFYSSKKCPITGWDNL